LDLIEECRPNQVFPAVLTVSPGTRIWDQYKEKFHVDEAMWFAPGRKEYISFDSSHKFLKIPAGRRLMDFEEHLKTIREKGVLNPHTEAELRWAQERLADCFAPNYDLAMLLKREQRFEEASAFLAQALRIRPTFDKGWIDLGECYDRLGQLDQALVCWHQAAVTEGIIPQNLAISLFYLGLGLEVKGDLEGALGLWKRAAATFPSYGAPFQRLAERCVQLGRWTEAREAAEAWARLDPDSGRAWHHAALAALGQGEADTAQAHFEKALGLMPENPDLYCDYAVLMAQAGLPGEALKIVRTCLDIAPEHPRARDFDQKLRKALESASPSPPSPPES
jgi:tetratricopeptide (TPR) repeat protein